MLEKPMRQVVVKVLKPLDAQSMEVTTRLGVPDVNYAGGWIELKRLASWPKRENTVVSIRHFTPEQRIWLIKRKRAGGNAYLLLKVQNEWLLLDGETAALSIGKVTKSELRSISLGVAHGVDELTTLLLSKLES